MYTILGAENLETFINNLSVTVTVVGSILVVILVIIAAAIERAKRAQHLKLPLFVAIAVVVLGTTFTIGGGTVYLNLASATGGPVHWHADFQIWACNNELNLRDPVGFSNKIGTPTLHEHNDQRIHLEGVPVSLPYDYSIGKFMTVVGGGISRNTLSVPLSDTGYFEGQAPNPEQIDPYIHTNADGKSATFINGETCGTQPAEVQLFAYHYNQADKTYRQTKIDDPANYSPAHESNVPPGDCVIMEFAPAKARTDKLCQQYGVRDQQRCGDFGVSANQRQACDSKEMTPSTCSELGKDPVMGITFECSREVE